MPKKTTILIVILAIITGVLIFLAIRSDQGQNLLGNDQQDVTPTQTQPFASISFMQPELDATSGTTTHTVDVILDTYGKPVAGVQLELTYDPTVLTNVKVETPQESLFGPTSSVLISSVDPTQGRISYAVGISASDTEKVGRGAVATITFTVNRQAGITTTNLAFLPKSAVTTFSTQGSVLSSTDPLQIQILPTVAQ